MLTLRAHTKTYMRTFISTLIAPKLKATEMSTKRRLDEHTVVPAVTPLSTFYIWASIEKLPAPLNDADTFFHACLQKKVMTVPGRFFDIRPFRDRPEPEPLRHWVRFSYGPSFDTVKTGLERIEQVIAEYR